MLIDRITQVALLPLPTGFDVVIHIGEGGEFRCAKVERIPAEVAAMFDVNCKYSLYCNHPAAWEVSTWIGAAMPTCQEHLPDTLKYKKVGAQATALILEAIGEG